jgi:hypothetical protein
LCTNNLLLEVPLWLVHHGLLLRAFFGAVAVAGGRTTVAAFFGLSSSLKKKIIRVQEKEKVKRKNIWTKYTHESSNSKISSSKPLTVDCSCGTSFRLDIPEEVKSSVRFCFLSAP